MTYYEYHVFRERYLGLVPSRDLDEFCDERLNELGSKGWNVFEFKSSVEKITVDGDISDDPENDEIVETRINFYAVAKRLRLKQMVTGYKNANRG